MLWGFDGDSYRSLRGFRKLILCVLKFSFTVRGFLVIGFFGFILGLRFAVDFFYSFELGLRFVRRGGRV